MRAFDPFLDAVAGLVRKIMRVVARALNRLSGGRLSPNAVTLLGLLMHIPIALLIAQDYRFTAAILLIIFGLFDTLDGELARLQKRTSAAGMLLDSVTDRMKEVMLYIGIAFALSRTDQHAAAVWATAACGGALLVSYVNAWGEVAVNTAKLKHTVNKSFRGGLMRFEVRIFLVFIALLTGWLAVMTAVIAILSWLNALDRLLYIKQRLQR